MYSMCGLGTSCEIASGTPSVERGRLVRREILELALYTFKYAHGIQNVIALMPTTPGKTAKYVVYLRKSDLDAKLKQPLDTTLGKTVPLAKAIPTREVHLIDSTTVPGCTASASRRRPGRPRLRLLAGPRVTPSQRALNP
jgi:hypothetical protein